ncbi:MAG: hypothetical protein DRQ49_02020 [Gammaproteobacteria bacterium]|nr:MAG: hypothetical protein DRQ49_02020 [Gammaproteobacteria bacterium]RKZ72968.1 MAG: hypothetical protein DRQ57_15845 [Gammaproteobacteria bacterium]
METEKIKNEAYQQMGSLNHSIAQARLTSLLSNDERFTPAIELGLDISQLDLSQFAIKAKDELKPDLCCYPNSVGLVSDDVLKMSDMPLLVVEILSPKQTIDDILSKFKAYFALGIKSCWLVMPAIKSIAVYLQFENFKTFGTNDTELVDDVLDIRLPLKKIFR